MKYFISCLALIIFLISCTDSKPEISFGFIQLVLYQGETNPEERYSFFIAASDDDGFANLEELYLYHDREQLFWQIKSDEWVTFTQGDETWIGTRSIAPGDGSTLPRGVFRAVLVNKGGERAERIFTYDGNVRFPFPRLVISDGNYSVYSQWPINRLICYDREGNYLAAVILSSLQGSIADINLPANTLTVSLWAEDTANFNAAYTYALPLN